MGCTNCERRAVEDHVVHPADYAADTVMRPLAGAKLLKAVVCSMKNSPQRDDGERHEYCKMEGR